MAISKTQLNTNALQIKNETNPGANAALRVGSFAEDLNNSTIGHFVPTAIELAALVSTSSFNTYTLYVISAVGNTRTLECRALTAGATTLVARDLTTGESGIYVLATDKFYPSIQKFKKIITQSDILAGGSIWQVITAFAKKTGTTYDGGSVFGIRCNGNGRDQFSDLDGTVLSANTFTGALIQPQVLNGAQSNLSENAGLVASIDSGSSTGTGTLTVYGTAILVTL
jgi:hypothetical protein